MGAFTDLLAKLDERCTRLDQIVEAIADIRRLYPPRKQRSARQLRLPFFGRTKRLRRKTTAWASVHLMAAPRANRRWRRRG